MGQGTQVAEDTLLRVFPDGTGVQNHNIGAFRFLHNGVAALGQVATELFGVGFVLLAAVGFDICGGGNILIVPVGGDFIATGELSGQLAIGNHGSFGVHLEFLQ